MRPQVCSIGDPVWKTQTSALCLRLQKAGEVQQGVKPHQDALGATVPDPCTTVGAWTFECCRALG